MAFDQPLEADRVDDLNLFSFLVRAPVVGTLMWMLGGDEAKKREEEEQLKKDLFAGVGSDSSSSQPAVELYRKPLHQSSQLKRFENMKMGKKSAPLLLGSDISDFGECAIEEEAREAKRLDKQRAFDFKKSRKMSWSDETGQDLVEYVEEVSWTFPVRRRNGRFSTCRIWVSERFFQMTFIIGAASSGLLLIVMFEIRASLLASRFHVLEAKLKLFVELVLPSDPISWLLLD